MSLIDNIISQLGAPRGRVGGAVLSLLNVFNAGMNRATLEALKLQPADKLLELGFGGGDLMARARKHAPGLQVAGAERSATAVASANKRFRRAVLEGSVSLDRVDRDDLPYPDASFSAACSVNTIYFMQQPESVFRELRRVLAPSGRLALCYGTVAPIRPAWNDGKTICADRVESMLANSGFGHCETQRHKDLFNGRYCCCVATV